MRQLIVSVPRGKGDAVLQMAQANAGVNLARFEATDLDHPIDLVLIHVSNKKVEGLVDQLETLPDMHLTLLPSAVMALYPPANSAPEQIKEVQERSPIEIFLAGLQSVGSWRGFLAYAAAAAVVVWIGLYTNTNYLLVAAMLIAPFAGPAMNTAIATARGDWRLLWRSLVRYFAAIATTIAVSTLLTFVIQPEIATNLMISTSKIASVAVLLPIAAGAAGAIHLMQSEQSSLVSGAAVGILIAASLAPPAGIVGMALVLGRFDIVTRSSFLLLLQLVGINLSAALIFRTFGLSSKGARYTRGKRWLFPIVLGGTIVALSGLLSWQFEPSVALERSSLEQQATAAIASLVEEQPNLQYLSADVRFTQSTPADPSTLMALVYVQETPTVPQSEAEISNTLSTVIKTELNEMFEDTTSLVDITVLEP
jgi:uncharacterized hydrophobic protein (TIGR00271 family)